MLDQVKDHPLQDACQPDPHVRGFHYDTAFSRTLGWITRAEQQRLRLSCVAIAGMGGVGGAHAITLARLGIGRFRLADFDRFESVNFNRQFGAGISTIGQPKVEVIAAAIRDINPEAEIEIWPQGVQENQASAFVSGTDLFIDGIDFFVLQVRRTLFAAARAAGVPAVTAAPLGTGVAWLSFVPGGQSFEDYFAFSARQDDPDNYIRFLVGLAPSALHMGALVDRSRVDFAAQRGPSTPMACMQCAGVAVTEGMKLILGRKGVRAAPWHHQFDPDSGRKISRRAWMGRQSPLRRLKVAIAGKLVHRATAAPIETLSEDQPLAARVIDLARWAPSGDNGQDWQFAVESEHRFTVSFPPFDKLNPYQYAEGRPHWLAAGALIEAIALAASRFGAVAAFEGRPTEQGGWTYAVALSPQGGRPDPLSLFLETRCVDRRSYRTTPLSAREKADLSALLPVGLSVAFFETARERLAAAWLNAQSTVLRMAIPQAWAIHAKAFRFDADQPQTGIPMRSVPLDPLSRRLLAWSMKSAGRMRLVSRTLLGARLASIQTDIVPGLSSAAAFALRLTTDERDPQAMIAAGRGMLRFWLGAERLGLVVQPAVATLVLAHPDRKHLLPLDASLERRAGQLNRQATALYGEIDGVAFAGRIGRPQAPHRPIRSWRRPVNP